MKKEEENIGAKIKLWAAILYAISFIFVGAIGLYLIIESENSLVGILVIVGGYVGSYVNFLLMTGFGQLIENTTPTNKW